MAKKRRRPAKRPKRKKHILLGRKRGLLLPRAALAKPPSLFERRMSELVFNVPPIGTPEAARLRRLLEMDVAFQLRLKELEKKLPHLLRARLKGGSGLQLSKLLRSYFLEYFDRLFKHGPQSFPTSFNVIESFLSFDQKYRFFDLRGEIEHLLSISDYFLWYENEEMPQAPRILEDVVADARMSRSQLKV